MGARRRAGAHLRAPGLLHRKQTLELVRLYREVSGYVVTGEADTPISSAGMWDASDRLKFAPAEFRAFNDDWCCCWAGIAGASGPAAATAPRRGIPGATPAARPCARTWSRRTMAAPTRPAHVIWAAALAGEPPFAAGEFETPFALAPGSLRELGVAEFVAPAVDRPRQLVLTADVRVGEEQSANAWPLWLFPRNVWRTAHDITLLDPSGRLRELNLDERDERRKGAFFVLRPSSFVSGARHHLDTRAEHAV